jgi:hypothetical protein
MKTSRNERKSVKRSPGKPNKHSRRPVSGNDHPAPFGSVLWDHYETIQKMRLARKSWPAISLHLDQAHGVKADHTTIYNFFKRATRILREGRLPLGFKDPRSGASSTHVPAGPAQPGSPPEGKPAAAAPKVQGNPAASMKEKYAKHQADFMKKKAAQIQNEQRIYIHKPDED